MSEIEATFRRLRGHCAAVIADIAWMHELLARGEGAPISGELTPEEIRALSELLTPIFEESYGLMLHDLATTARREQGYTEAVH